MPEVYLRNIWTHQMSGKRELLVQVLRIKISTKITQARSKKSIANHQLKTLYELSLVWWDSKFHHLLSQPNNLQVSNRPETNQDLFGQQNQKQEFQLNFNQIKNRQALKNIQRLKNHRLLDQPQSMALWKLNHQMRHQALLVILWGIHHRREKRLRVHHKKLTFVELSKQKKLKTNKKHQLPLVVLVQINNGAWKNHMVVVKWRWPNWNIHLKTTA